MHQLNCSQIPLKPIIYHNSIQVNNKQRQWRSERGKNSLWYYYCEAPQLTVTLPANSADNELSNGAGIKKTDTFIKTAFSHERQQEMNWSLNCKGVQWVLQTLTHWGEGRKEGGMKGRKGGWMDGWMDASKTSSKHPHLSCKSFAFPQTHFCFYMQWPRKHLHHCHVGGSVLYRSIHWLPWFNLLRPNAAQLSSEAPDMTK